MTVGDIDLEKVQKVVHAWGEWLENTMPDLSLKYPSMKIPESVLPYPRKVIEYALSVFTEEMERRDDEKALGTLRSTAMLLENVVSDEEARTANEKLFDSSGWYEAAFKKRAS